MNRIIYRGVIWALVICVLTVAFSPCASASEPMNAVSVSGKKQEGRYAIDAYGIWYSVNGSEMRALGSADPLSGQDIIIREEPIAPGAQVVNGYIRLVWPRIEGALEYRIDRSSESDTQYLGTLNESGYPPEFYDFSAEMDRVYVYKITGLDAKSNAVKDYVISVSLPAGNKMRPPNSMSVRIWGISFRDGLLSVYYDMPKGAKIYACLVSVTTKSGRTLFGTQPGNYQVLHSDGVVTIKFYNELVRGDYTAHIWLNVWNGGTLPEHSDVNPYATPTLHADFSTK